MRIYDTIVTQKTILKGWSGDTKYCATTADGTKYLLRVTPAERAYRFQLCYHRMEEAAKLGIPMCLPVEFGQCPEGTYALHSWIDGVDAESYIPTLPNEKQYSYGLDAGRILRKLHTLPAPADAISWSDRFNTKIDRKIDMYEACALKYDRGERFISFLEENRYLISDRPQTYQHGDYHIGNMMVDQSGILIIIDFDRDDHGDPWEEFNRIVWCAQASPAFASGMVDGYFNGAIPIEFWKLLALYISCNTLSSLPWAIPFGDREIQTMRDQAAQVLCWYADMTNPVPTWYMPIEIEEIPIERIQEFWNIHMDYLVNDGIVTDEEDIQYFQSDEYRETIKAHMLRSVDRHHMLYFLRDGQRIGAAQYNTYHSEDGKCFVLDFWVFPQYRGNGIGRRCFEALRKYTAADGAKYFEINCDRDNARRFWCSLGFVDTGVDEDDMPLMQLRDLL